MNLKSAVTIFACLFMALISGCMSIGGTFEESHKNKIYIGTRTVVESATPGWSHWQANVPFALIMLPFEITADTLFLPYTIYFEAFERNHGMQAYNTKDEENPIK
jgi:uncharacterized protein YceK